MYTLRILESNGIVSNHHLVSAYSRSRKNVFKQFNAVMAQDNPDSDIKFVESLITGQTGETFFVNETKTSGNHYFIMTESGKTFERL